MPKTRDDILTAYRQEADDCWVLDDSVPQIAKSTTLERASAGGVPCEWVLAKGADPRLRIMHVHGGGFMAGTLDRYRLHQRVAEALAQRFPQREPSMIVEERMYEGFPSRTDERRMAAFRGASGAERAELVETYEDDRLRELGRRLVFFEHPEAIDQQCRTMLEEWLRNRRHGCDGIVAGRTLTAASAELEPAAAAFPGHESEIEVIRRWLRAA